MKERTERAEAEVLRRGEFIQRLQVEVEDALTLADELAEALRRRRSHEQPPPGWYQDEEAALAKYEALFNGQADMVQEIASLKDEVERLNELALHRHNRIAEERALADELAEALHRRVDPLEICDALAKWEEARRG